MYRWPCKIRRRWGQPTYWVHMYGNYKKRLGFSFAPYLLQNSLSALYKSAFHANNQWIALPTLPTFFSYAALLVGPSVRRSVGPSLIARSTWLMAIRLVSKESQLYERKCPSVGRSVFSWTVDHAFFDGKNASIKFDLLVLEPWEGDSCAPARARSHTQPVDL